MTTEDDDSKATTTEGQAEFLAGSIAGSRFDDNFLDEESLRRAFAIALGADFKKGISQSSCHFIRAMIQSGVIRLGKQ